MIEMSIQALFQQHREYYLHHFKNALKQCYGGASEVLLEIKNEEPNELFRLYRFDYLNFNEEGKPSITDFDTDGYLNHETIKFEAETVKIEINPFVWNGCEIALDHEPNSWDTFYEWIRTWIDLEDEHRVDEDALSGLIHNVTKPYKDGGWIITSIDLGTAPVDALIELLNLFIKDGAIEKIRIYS